MPVRPRYYEYDARFGLVIDRDLAEWLEYVLTHYVLADKNVFHYQIDRVAAVRFRRTLLSFMEGRDGTSGAALRNFHAEETGVGADDPDRYGLRSRNEQDD